MVGKAGIGQIHLRVDFYSPANFAPPIFIHLPTSLHQYLFTVTAGKMGQFGAAIASASDTHNY
jgi:hypothetical protein